MYTFQLSAWIETIFTIHVASSYLSRIATETLAGIKTVASLCAQPHFTSLYSHHISESSRQNIRAAFLSSLVAGVTGALFYVTYIFAFYIGTQQVAEDMGTKTIIRCLLSQEPNCRVTGAR